jgi:hypothetical protein
METFKIERLGNQNSDTTSTKDRRFESTYLVPKLRDFLWLGTNLAGADESLREPDPLEGERLSEAAEPRLCIAMASVTDSFEEEELGTGDGGSSLKESLQQNFCFNKRTKITAVVFTCIGRLL